MQNALNSLLQLDKIEVKQDPQTGSILYTYVDAKSVKLYNQMDNIEKMVYQILYSSGEMGCTLQELRSKVMETVLLSQGENQAINST